MPSSFSLLFFYTYGGMGSTAARKPKRVMEKLAKCARKLKRIFKSLKTGSSSEVVNYSVSSPHAVACEELFLSSGVQNGHRINDDHDHDPSKPAHIAAQNHFTFRPNIYI
ncbi:hypothetical protein Peur_021722 [Populus x canadensis]